MSGAVLTACASPTAAPTAAPTKAPEASKPQATAAPASAPAAQASAAPAQAAPATTSAPRLVLAVEGEPETGLVPNNACSLLTNFPVYNIYEYLTMRTTDGKIVGQLAESFERTDDKTWRFKLRKNVKFSNGEAFNADAVLAAVDHEMKDGQTGRCKNEYTTLTTPAKKIDDYTVDLITSEPDPLLATKIMRFKIPAPNWLKTTSAEQLAVTAVGSGPYLLTEWVKGDHLTLKLNPNYWGDKKATIPEVRIVGRKEASVRAAMVQAGEAHIAYAIAEEQMKQVPKTVIEKTTECAGFRINTEHPVLKDVRVRQAIAYAIDTKGIMDALYPKYSTPLNGHMVRTNCNGYNPNLKDYPFDKAKAKQLVTDAKATGTPLEIYVRDGNWAKITELGEAIAGAISETGLVCKPKVMDAALWRESLMAVKPGQARSDLLLLSASNPTFDSVRVMQTYYPCDGVSSYACDQSFTTKFKQVIQQSGETRTKGFQELWAYAYDQYWMIPLFGLDFIHGVSNKLKWTPREDSFTLFSEMQLDA
jgi:peptide/nickel transport system substrate-binding protein